MRHSSKTPMTDAYGRTAASDAPEEAEARSERLLRRRSYEKFFEGYTEYRVVRPSGRGRIERRYTGSLYRREQTVRQHIQTCVLYLLLAAVAAILLISALVMPVASNRSWHVALSELPLIVLFIRFVYILCIYVTSGQKIRMREYRVGVKALPGAARLTAYTTTLPVIFSAVIILSGSGTFSLPEVIRLVMLLGSGLAVWIIGRIEADIRYQEVPSRDTDISEVKK